MWTFLLGFILGVVAMFFALFFDVAGRVYHRIETGKWEGY